MEACCVSVKGTIGLEVVLNAEHKTVENDWLLPVLLHFAETVVGESVVVIKKLLQMQVWTLFRLLQRVLALINTYT